MSIFHNLGTDKIFQFFHKKGEAFKLANNFEILPSMATRKIAVTPTATAIYNTYYGLNNTAIINQTFPIDNLPYDYGWNPNDPLRLVRSLIHNSYTGPLSRSYVVTTHQTNTWDGKLAHDIIVSHGRQPGLNPDIFTSWNTDFIHRLKDNAFKSLNFFSNWHDKLAHFVFSSYNGPSFTVYHNIPNNIEPYATIQHFYGSTNYKTYYNKNGLKVIYKFLKESNGCYLISFNDAFKIAFENKYGSLFEISNVRNLYVLEHPHNICDTTIGELTKNNRILNPQLLSNRGDEELADVMDDLYWEARDSIIIEDDDTFGTPDPKTDPHSDPAFMDFSIPRNVEYIYISSHIELDNSDQVSSSNFIDESVRITFFPSSYNYTELLHKLLRFNLQRAIRVSTVSLKDIIIGSIVSELDYPIDLDVGFLDYTSEDVDFDPSLVPIRQTTEDLTRRIRLATSEGLNIASELGDPSEDISSDSESSSDSDSVIYSDSYSDSDIYSNSDSPTIRNLPSYGYNSPYFDSDSDLEYGSQQFPLNPLTTSNSEVGLYYSQFNVGPRPSTSQGWEPD